MFRWCTGWAGRSTPQRRPLAGRPVPGWRAAWSVGWPTDRVRTARAPDAALAVIGQCGATDAQLAAALGAVRAGRWHALTEWPGSYLMLAAHGPLTVVLGDLTGQHPLFWRACGEGVWWASAAVPLAAADPTDVDEVALAAHLAAGQPDLLADRALVCGVHRVPTGHLLRLEGGGATVARYEPVEYPPVPMAEGCSAVAAVLREAVASRLGERAVSCDLAGLDSTTLACLAAQNDAGPVTATTFTHPRLRDDDLAFARRTVAAVPGLRHRVVTGTADTVYYSGLEDLECLPPTDAPTPYTVTAAIKRAVLTAAVDRGPGGVHFTGAGGDTVLSAVDYLPDLLRARAWRTAFPHAQARARLGRTSPWSVLRRAWPAARTTLPDAVRASAAELRCPAHAWDPAARRPPAWVPLLATAAWMTARARLRLADALDEAAGGLDAAPRTLIGWTDRQDLRRLGANLAGWRALAQAFGVEVAAPYLDNEVVRACLAIPGEERGAPGRYKPLLAAAFPHGPLPDFVLARTTKGCFNGISYEGLRVHAPTLRALLGPSSRLAALGLLDPTPVSAALQRAAAGQRVPQGALHLAVATEVWLRQLDAQLRPTAWWQEVNRRAAA
ncbi:albusnodin/ikarugamycin family macrolactam cyclase [Streptomyces sp. NPDC003077]|uniref:albusnodin/ikarugamycin family macrolactam cyclase n=1 Tax=Streptomyces sp. NPDC003077 TaxID=3154443 RepID=UPI0033A30087